MTLKNLQKEGKSIFMSSHILAELQEFVDSITILDHGKVLYNGETKKLKENKDLVYEVRFQTKEDNLTFENFLSKSKIKFEIIDKTYEVSFKNFDNIDKALKLIATQKLRVLYFSLTLVKSLQNIYDNIVAQGAQNA